MATVVRTFIVGTAASLIAASVADAADLPVKAKPIEYMRICSAYGAGFFFIPGTDTCMKIGGYLRVDTTFNGGVQGSPAWNGDAGQHNRYFDYFAARSRMLLSIDTRTDTEYGVVRTFGQGRFQFSTLGNNTFNPNSINGSLPVAGSQLLDTPGGGVTTIQFLFIQFAGFTFGQSASAYSSPWQGFPGNISDFLLGGQNNDTGVNNIQYTADFGNGITGTIGLDDPTVWDRTNVFNLSLPLNATLTSGNAYAGVHAPDVVGNIRIDQAWGLFQISAAAHEVNASYNVLNALGAPAGAVGLPGAAPTGASELSGHPDTSWGGAVMAALQIKNIPTGAGDDIKMDASYAKGATKYVISSASTSPSFAIFGSPSAFGAYQSIGFGATTDAVRQFVDDEVGEAVQVVQHQLLAAKPALVAVTEDEALRTDFHVVAGVPVVSAHLERSQGDAERQRIERLGEQPRRPVQHDARSLPAGVAEHGLVGVEHVGSGFERFHLEKFSLTSVRQEYCTTTFV
jgi:hypothetical protein